MSDLPGLTTGQLRALRIAAARMPRTPRDQLVENHPLGRQYVDVLCTKGLLRHVLTDRGELRVELTPLAVDVLRAHWIGEARTRPEPGLAEPPAGG